MIFDVREPFAFQLGNDLKNVRAALGELERSLIDFCRSIHAWDYWRGTGCPQWVESGRSANDPKRTLRPDGQFEYSVTLTGKESRDFLDLV